MVIEISSYVVVVVVFIAISAAVMVRRERS